MLSRYWAVYRNRWTHHFRRKFGLVTSRKGDMELFQEFLAMMRDREADFTQTFHELLGKSLDFLKQESLDHGSIWSLPRVYRHRNYKQWVRKYGERVQLENVPDLKRWQVMNQVNPGYVLRNWIAQLAIEEAEKGNYTTLQVVQKSLQNPFEPNHLAEKMGFSEPPPSWSWGLKVSCSS